jgi:nucleotide-binding universal stress UspA family protein
MLSGMTQRANGRVVAATDLSDVADEALRQADEWATRRGRELVVAFVVPQTIREASAFPPAYADDAVALLELERRAEELVVERVCRVTRRRASDFRVIIDGGRADLGIVRVAGEERADLIVVGNRRSSALERLLLGSISERVVRYAHCSVLVSRASRRTGVILAATDLSDAALPAVSAAIEVAREQKAALTVMHAVEASPAEGRDAMTAEWRRKIAASLTKLVERSGLEIVFDVAHGPPADSIVLRAEELGAELIVVGTRGRSGMARLAYGSVAETVARTASCSVLAVRHDEHA